MNLRGFADEIHLRHDAMEEEHKAVAEIFDRLRQEKRDEGLTKPEVQEFVGDFKELIRAERKYGRDLIGYEAKNERVRSLAALVYGNPSRRIEPPAPNKRTHNVPGAIEGPSENVLRACASEPIEPVASAPPRTPSDGAAVSNSPAPDTAAINPEPATVLSPDLTDSGGALPEQPRSPPGDAPTNCELEGAVRTGLHLNGQIEHDRETCFPAPSSISDDFNDIPLCLRRASAGGFLADHVSLDSTATSKADARYGEQFVKV